MSQYGERWDSIAKFLKDRTDIQCQQRWTKVVNPELIKGPWTKEVSLKNKFNFQKQSIFLKDLPILTYFYDFLNLPKI